MPKPLPKTNDSSLSTSRRRGRPKLLSSFTWSCRRKARLSSSYCGGKGEDIFLWGGKVLLAYFFLCLLSFSVARTEEREEGKVRA